MNRTLSQIEQRMAFYAGYLKNGKLTLNDEDAEEWLRDLPKAIEGQYICLDRGDLPVKFTMDNLRRLKTLAIKNENFGALQRDGECGQNGEGDGTSSSERR